MTFETDPAFRNGPWRCWAGIVLVLLPIPFTLLYYAPTLREAWLVVLVALALLVAVAALAFRHPRVMARVILMGSIPIFVVNGCSYSLGGQLSVEAWRYTTAGLLFAVSLGGPIVGAALLRSATRKAAIS